MSKQHKMPGRPGKLQRIVRANDPLLRRSRVQWWDPVSKQWLREDDSEG